MERFSLPLDALDGLRYFIVALPEPSINYFVIKDVQYPYIIFLLYEYMGKIEIGKFFDTRTEVSPHAINYKKVVL